MTYRQDLSEALSLLSELISDIETFNNDYYVRSDVVAQSLDLLKKYEEEIL